MDNNKDLYAINLLDFYRSYQMRVPMRGRYFSVHHSLFCSKISCLCLNWNLNHSFGCVRVYRHEVWLRSGAVIQGSHLLVYDWFAVMFLLTATKRAISVKRDIVPNWVHCQPMTTQTKMHSEPKSVKLVTMQIIGDF